MQSRWKETGPVPQADLKDLWRTITSPGGEFLRFHQDKQELRDLDLRRNLERKTALCEEAEALVLNPSVIEAFRRLQKLHTTKWRETGPWPRVRAEALWERFRAASGRINKLHQAHFRGDPCRAGAQPRTPKTGSA